MTTYFQRARRIPEIHYKIRKKAINTAFKLEFLLECADIIGLVFIG